MRRLSDETMLRRLTEFRSGMRHFGYWPEEGERRAPLFSSIEECIAELRQRVKEREAKANEGADTNRRLDKVLAKIAEKVKP